MSRFQGSRRSWVSLSWVWLLLAGVGGLGSAAEPGTLVGWGGGGFNPFTRCDEAVNVFAASETRGLVQLEGGDRLDFSRGQWTGLQGLPKFQAVALGTYAGVALDADGVVWGFANEGVGAVAIKPLPLSGVAVAIREGLALILQEDGRLMRWRVRGLKAEPVPGITNAVAISAGKTRFAALLSDGSVVQWNPESDPTNRVPVLTGIRAIAASATAILGLQTNGTVAVSGVGLKVPTNLRDVIAIAAGDDHGLALRSNGTVVVFGSNQSGQLNIPEGLAEVMAIGAGPQSSFAVTRRRAPLILQPPQSQSVVHGRPVEFTVQVSSPCPYRIQWTFNGKPLTGETNLVYRIPVARPRQAGTYGVVIAGDHGVARAQGELFVAHTEVLDLGNLGSTQFVRPPLTQEVVAVAAGAYHSMVLLADGTVVAWGPENFGQSRVPPDLRDVVMIAAGSITSVALRADGTVVAWGDPARATVPTDLKPVRAIASGFHHTLALQVDGTVRIWGPPGTYVPPELDALTNIVAVAGGHDFSVTLDEAGKVRVFLAGPPGALAVPADLPQAKAIVAGPRQVFAILMDGSVRGWGDPAGGRLNIPAGLRDVVSLAVNDQGCGAVRRDGSTVFWPVRPPGDTSGAVQISGSRQHFLVLRDHNQLAPPDFEPGFPRDLTVRVGTEVEVRAPVTGTPPFTYRWFRNGRSWSSQDVLRVRADGLSEGFYSVTVGNRFGEISSPEFRLGVWGIPAGQMIGWGNNTNFATRPTFALEGIRTAAVGSNFVVALTPAGTVEARGLSPFGQTNVPSGLTGVVDIAAGDGHVLALRNDGTVVAWGDNSQGQAQVPEGLAGVTRIAAGAQHSLVLRQDGQLVAWGKGERGATQVPTGLRNVVAIAAGGDNSAALQADGQLVVWGDNQFGQTGPNLPTGLKAVSLGIHHGLGLRFDGTVQGWGRNDVGQAQPPPGLSQVVAVSAGELHSVALTQEGTVVLWGGGGTVISNFPADLRGVVSIAAGRLQTVALRGAPPPGLTIRREASGPGSWLQMMLNPGWRYQFEQSEDLRTWLPVGTDFLAESMDQEWALGDEASGSTYFRLRPVP